MPKERFMRPSCVAAVMIGTAGVVRVVEVRAPSPAHDDETVMNGAPLTWL